LTKIEAPRAWRLIQRQGITMGVKLERGSSWHLARSQPDNLIPEIPEAGLTPEVEAQWKKWKALYNKAERTGDPADWAEWENFRRSLRPWENEKTEE
jgi:hypothetical protein